MINIMTYTYITQPYNCAHYDNMFQKTSAFLKVKNILSCHKEIQQNIFTVGPVLVIVPSLLIEKIEGSKHHGITGIITKLRKII